MSFSYQMRFSKTGRARFIAHLDTLSCLTRAVRRTGFELAQTQGFRPKPILSLAMPLGVGVEGEDEICDFSLAQRAPLSDLARRLNNELPEGMELIMVAPSFERRKAAARVESVSYRIELENPPADYEAALGSFNDTGELVILRKRPKGDKDVDLKKYVARVDMAPAAPQGGGIVFDMKVTREGTGRPEEIIAALAGFAGTPLTISRIVRTSITLKEEPPPAPLHQRRGRRRGRW